MADTFEKGMAIAELTFREEEVLKDVDNIAKGIQENEAYEVSKDLFSNGYIVRVGNHIKTRGDKERWLDT